MDCPERLAAAGISVEELALGRYGLLPVATAEKEGHMPGPLAALLWKDLDATSKVASSSTLSLSLIHI